MIEEHEPARLSEAVVARKVAEHLKDCHLVVISLEVDPKHVCWEGFWWKVCVRPSKELPKLSKYYEALACVEAALEEQEHLTVFLAPGQPNRSSVIETLSRQMNFRPGESMRILNDSACRQLASGIGWLG